MFQSVYPNGWWGTGRVGGRSTSEGKTWLRRVLIEGGDGGDGYAQLPSEHGRN